MSQEYQGTVGAKLGAVAIAEGVGVAVVGFFGGLFGHWEVGAAIGTIPGIIIAVILFLFDDRPKRPQ